MSAGGAAERAASSGAVGPAGLFAGSSVPVERFSSGGAFGSGSGVGWRTGGGGATDTGGGGGATCCFGGGGGWSGGAGFGRGGGT
jgi:hypothetical protein